jgi:hypothetical protein
VLLSTHRLAYNEIGCRGTSQQQIAFYEYYECYESYESFESYEAYESYDSYESHNRVTRFDPNKTHSMHQSGDSI